MDSASITVPLPLSPSASTTTAPTKSPSSVSTHCNNDSGVRLPSHKRSKLDVSTSASQPDSASVERPSQSFLRIDVPMRAFTGGYYPQLLALYRHLGIRTKKTNFTYSFATLPPPSPTWASSTSSTRSPSPCLPSTAISEIATTKAPSPNIIYNGANGLGGVSLPSHLRNPSFPSRITISDILTHLNQIRTYFSSLITLILGYFQLLIIALWHHYLGHTSDPSHPLRSYTLQDLLQNPFPPRPAPSRFSIRNTIQATIESLLRKIIRLNDEFAHHTLAPLFSAVMTCTLASVWSCPATQVLDYVALTLGKDHFVVKDGVRSVVTALLRHLPPPSPCLPSEEQVGGVWTNAEVRSVSYRDRGAYIRVFHHPPSGAEEMLREHSSGSATTDPTFVKEGREREHGPYHHVIFATQANQTAHFLRQYSESIPANHVEKDRLRQVIGALDRFKYEKSTVVNHMDPQLLPKNELDWRDLNLVTPHHSCSFEKRQSGDLEWVDSPTLPSTKSAAGGYTMATHLLTSPVSHSDLLLMQTTNPCPSLVPHPSLRLSSSTFERAVLDVESHIARQGLFHFSTSSSHTKKGVKTAGGRKLVLGPLQQTQKGKRVKVWVCGSYAVGIPLLEACVVSARLIAEEIVRLEGITLPDSVRWS